uniref:Predicted protein n=1 Tax=Hordeum vulgare subsp. vulgare TaxID=112509 RepID=F2DV52_HORVV|nr:predicted protein [Hordeum vulgare subsp. vulgare]
MDSSKSGSNSSVEVLLFEATDIKPKSKNGNSNLYVRMKTGDGMFNWTKSHSVMDFSSPKWDFKCTLKVKPAQSKVLRLRIMESSIFMDDLLGECSVDLEGMEWNEPQDLWVDLKNCATQGRVHLKITYFPFGRSVFSISSPNLRMAPEIADKLLNIDLQLPLIAHSKSHNNTPEQIEAESLYNRAIQLVAEFANNSSEGALRAASESLHKSIGLFRMGKSFAILAFVLYQFDHIEQSSKYLKCAEQLDPSFQFINKLRQVILADMGKRECNGAFDKLSISILDTRNFTMNAEIVAPSLTCKILVGYNETSRETSATSPSTPSSSTAIPALSLDGADVVASFNPVWNEFFDVPLTKAADRYQYGHQNLKLQFYHNPSGEGQPPVLVGECESEIDLFACERNTVFDKWLPLKDGHGEVHIVFNYQMGKFTDSEAASLVYQSVYSRDAPLIEAIIKRNHDINHPFREFAYASKDLEPQYSTPLTKAARFGCLRMIKELVNMGAKVNAKDVDGYTPIMRAVQFDGVYNNSRAINLLLDMGADLELENNAGWNTFGFCNTTQMKHLLNSRTVRTLYEFMVIICSNCKYYYVPQCQENDCLRTDDCKCPPVSIPCPHCKNNTINQDAAEFWIISSREMNNLVKGYTKNLPDHIDHYVATCAKCRSFGFPGTISKEGPRLTTREGDKIVGTVHQTNERDVYTLKESETLWKISHHASGCPIPSASTFLPIVFYRKDAERMLKLSKNTPAWVQKQQHFLPLNELPREVLELVMSNLTCEDIFSCERVCKSVRKISCHESFWRNYFNSNFKQKSKITTQVVPASPLITNSWKNVFIHFVKIFNWIGQLLLEESFKPRYDIQICENGEVEVQLFLVGKKYLFNLDGNAFTFDGEFCLKLAFKEIGKLQRASLHATSQPVSKIVDLCALVTVPPKITTEQIREHDGRVSITLSLMADPINKWINPYLSMMVAGFHSFLMLKDSVGGSIVMDFFYYAVSSILLEPKREDEKKTSDENGDGEGEGEGEGDGADEGDEAEGEGENEPEDANVVIV